MYRLALLGSVIVACSGGTPRAAEVRASPPSIKRASALPTVSTPSAAAAPVNSSYEWRAKLREIPRSSSGAATLELAADIPTSSFFALIGAARSTDFDAIDIARGNSVLRVSGPPPITDHEELVVILRTDSFFIEASTPKTGPRLFQQSWVFDGVGRQIKNFLTSTWPDTPCELTVLADSDVSLFTALDAAFGVSMARPCVSAFAFGWGEAAQREPRRPPPSGAHVLTLRVPPLPRSETPRPTVQEERDVRIDGVVEHWRLQWRDEPAPACFDWDCACSQFEYGQRGEADLIRTRPGSPDEVFPLAPLFDGHNDLPTHGLNETILRTWPTEQKDMEAKDRAALATEVRARPRVSTMDLHDYDHDGRATEFALPVGGAGCAYHFYIVVGISRTQPTLHVFGTAAHPDKPLELGWAGWEVLRKGSAGTFVALECDFRGADEQMEITLRAIAGGIRATTTRYTCPRATGRVIEKQRW